MPRQYAGNCHIVVLHHRHSMGLIEPKPWKAGKHTSPDFSASFTVNLDGKKYAIGICITERSHGNNAVFSIHGNRRGSIVTITCDIDAHRLPQWCTSLFVEL